MGLEDLTKEELIEKLRNKMKIIKINNWIGLIGSVILLIILIIGVIIKW